MCKYLFLVLGYRYTLSVVSFDTLKLLSVMRIILSLLSWLHVLLVSCLINLSKLEAIKSHSPTSSKISIVSPWTLTSPSLLELIFVYVTKKSHSNIFLYGWQSSQAHPLNIYPFPTEQLQGVHTGSWIQFQHPALWPLHTAIIPRAWYQVYISGRSHNINSSFGMSLLFLLLCFSISSL